MHRGPPVSLPAVPGARLHAGLLAGVLGSVLGGVLGATGCTHHRHVDAPRTVPTPSIQVGACGIPTRDGVVSAHPRLDHADRDLDGDGLPETIVVDRAMCTADHNCYWNVFLPPAPATSGDCSRYAGTFEAAALEPLATTGDDHMTDVRGYWNLHGDRLLLQSYRFTRGGYLLVDALQCRRETDDRLVCSDSESASRGTE